MDDKRTVRAIYEDGEITFAEPVELEGCWHVEVTFIQQEDPNAPYEANTHRPERDAFPGRLEELRRNTENQRPTSHY